MTVKVGQDSKTLDTHICLEEKSSRHEFILSPKDLDSFVEMLSKAQEHARTMRGILSVPPSHGKIVLPA